MKHLTHASLFSGITFSRWRMESIKAYGNAWVPQVAYEIFRAINEQSITS
jgi:DNA (cytosine-5)-methyltransferase 1